MHFAVVSVPDGGTKGVSGAGAAPAVSVRCIGALLPCCPYGGAVQRSGLSHGCRGCGCQEELPVRSLPHPSMLPILEHCAGSPCPVSSRPWVLLFPWERSWMKGMPLLRVMLVAPGCSGGGMGTLSSAGRVVRFCTGAPWRVSTQRKVSGPYSLGRSF